MEQSLILKNISYTYHTISAETKAIVDLSLSVSKSEFVALVGPSGCGKSTLLSIIAGILSPSKGTIEITNPLQTRAIGYMFQKDNLFEWRTIWKNVIIGLELQNKLTPKNITHTQNLLKKYGLWEFRSRYPSQLSGGMRQRAALIRTLALDPEILLLDEPFSALDFQTRLEVCDDVYSIIKKENKTVVMVTHDISEAISMADRVIVLSSRPAKIKNIFKINLAQSTPFKKREDPSFPKLFNDVWKEFD